MKMYFSSSFKALRSIQICAACHLKGVYTSSTEYDPTVTISRAREAGCKSVSENLAPMPREMNFVVSEGEWESHYQLARFPELTVTDLVKAATAPLKEIRQLGQRSARANPEKGLKPKKERERMRAPNDKCIVNHLPELGDCVVESRLTGEVLEHVESKDNQQSQARIKPEQEAEKPFMVLGAGLGLTSGAVWLDSGEVCFGCGLVVVLLNTETLAQRPLLGHNRPVTGVGYVANGEVIVSCQKDGVARLWDRNSGKGVSCLRTTVSAHLIECRDSYFALFGPSVQDMSKSGVTLFRLEPATSRVTLIATACTDHQISAVSVSPLTSGISSFVTGGTGGPLKVWRLARGNHLRSAAVDFGRYGSRLKIVSLQQSDDGVLIAAGGNGTIFRVDLERLSILEVHQLTLSGVGLGVTNIVMSGEHLLVAGEDQVARVWTPQLTSVTAQLDMEGQVVHLTRSGEKCLVTTNAASIGVIDLTTSSYSTYFRAPSQPTEKAALSGDLLATLSGVNELRVWKFRRAVNYAGSSSYSIVQLAQIMATEEELTSLALNNNTVAFGSISGRLRILKVTKPTDTVLDRVFNSGVNELHFGATGQLYCLLATGELISFSSCFQVSRQIRRGGAPHSKLTSSPGGRFLAVVAFDCPQQLQLYSSQLDPLVTINPPGCGFIMKFYFLGVSSMIVRDRERSTWLVNIAENRYSTINNNNYGGASSGALSGTYLHQARLHVSGGGEELTVATNDFTHSQGYLGHTKINHLNTVGDNLLTAGDVVLLWQIDQKDTREIRHDRERTILRYHDQKMKPALDATITVEKKSLFSVLNEEAETNEDDDELSVIEPTQPSSSGFPAFEPTLDITPPGQCSSPQLPTVQLATLEVQKQPKKQPEAKALVFAQTGPDLFDATQLSLPKQISPPKSGSEGISLKRVIGGGGAAACQWAPKRGCLYYAIGGDFCREELENSNQTLLHFSNLNLISLALAPDELSCCVFGVDGSGSNLGYVVDLEKMKQREYEIDAQGHDDQIIKSSVSPDSRYCLSLSGSYQSQLIVNGTWNGSKVTSTHLSAQVADIAWSGSSFLTAGVELRLWSFGREGALTSRIIPLPGSLSNELFTAVDSSPTYAVAGSLRGMVVVLNLESANFELEHFITVSEQTVDCVRLFTEGRFLVGSDKTLSFWRKAADVASGRDYDATDSYINDEEFELDGKCLDAVISPKEDESEEDMALCTTTAGTVVFCASETLATLVGSASGMTSLVSDSVYSITGHASGALKVWKTMETSAWKMLIQFQAAESVCSCAIDGDTLAAGYEKSLIRMFSICSGEMTSRIQVPLIRADSICALKFVPLHLLAGSTAGRVYLYDREGILQRQFNDHFNSGRITSIDYDSGLDHFQHLALGGQLWLVASEERKISVWTSVWERKGVHHLAAWITFPGVEAASARFSRTEPDHLYFWTKNTFFVYSLKAQVVLRQLSLPYCTSLITAHPRLDLFALATGRLLTLAEMGDDEFVHQDFVRHTEPICALHFGDERLLSATSRQLLDWQLN